MRRSYIFEIYINIFLFYFDSLRLIPYWRKLKPILLMCETTSHSLWEIPSKVGVCCVWLSHLVSIYKIRWHKNISWIVGS
jgi:hypothetical protein